MASLYSDCASSRDQKGDRTNVVTVSETPERKQAACVRTLFLMEGVGGFLHHKIMIRTEEESAIKQ